MTPQEADRVIAEYMECRNCLCLSLLICPSPSSHHDHCLNEGCGKYIDAHWKPYSKSLDSLVPVWEKIGGVFFNGEPMCDKGGGAYFCVDKELSQGRYLEQKALGYKTIQEAAAIATAKAIQTLSD